MVPALQGKLIETFCVALGVCHNFPLHCTQVITSKQRPRKLCIYGNNGKDYMLLLKGHEDLRQDERVMQLFGLVNRHRAQSK